MMHHDPRWRQEFEQTKSSILQSCCGGVIDVEHIGSTAISGLIAQPVIDLVAAVPDDASIDPDDASIDNVVMLIQGLNFRQLPTPVWAAGGVWLGKPRHGEITHCVALTRRGSRLWSRVLGVRDALRQDLQRAISFEEAKLRIWKQGEGEPQAYRRDKGLYFAHLEEQLGL